MQIFLRSTKFRKQFNELVWNVVLELKEFKVKWKRLMNDNNLEGKRWFRQMYDRRKSWMPLYFKDMSMHGLIKITSRFKSKKFFYKHTNHVNFLLYFMLNYDTKIG